MEDMEPPELGGDIRDMRPPALMGLCCWVGEGPAE